MKPLILVTGAAGNPGRYVVRQLRASTYPIRILAWNATVREQEVGKTMLTTLAKFGRGERRGVSAR